MTLNELKPGQECRVVKISAEGATGQRLLDMGLVSETRVKVIRNAPLMDPFDISIRGYSLALRRSDAKGIEIKLL